MLRHFLITRFCIGDPKTAKRGHYLDIDDSWIRHRLELFHKLVWPSVVNQTDQNFKWLILCNDHMRRFPEMQRYETKQSDVLFGFNRYFKSDAEDLIPIVQGRYINPRDTRVITTRLDSDDMLTPKHMEIVKERAVDVKDGTTLSFVNGSVLHKGKFFPVEELDNHFISYVEGPENVQTCYRDWHKGMTRRHPAVFESTDEPMWVEVLHDRNAKNTPQKRGLC